MKYYLVDIADYNTGGQTCFIQLCPFLLLDVVGHSEGNIT